MKTTLQTERLVIRPFTEADLDELYRLVYADLELKRRWSGRSGTSEEIKDGFWREHGLRQDGFGFRAVVRRTDGQLLGLIGFQRYEPGEDTSFMVFDNEADRPGVDPERLEVELTYAFGREYWGQGYAAEAGRALLEHGFNDLGIYRIVNSVDSANFGSVNLMRRLDFRLLRNLNPQPFPGSGAPGVIGILDNMRLNQR